MQARWCLYTVCGRREGYKFAVLFDRYPRRSVCRLANGPVAMRGLPAWSAAAAADTPTMLQNRQSSVGCVVRLGCVVLGSVRRDVVERTDSRTNKWYRVIEYIIAYRQTDRRTESGSHARPVANAFDR